MTWKSNTVYISNAFKRQEFCFHKHCIDASFVSSTDTVDGQIIQTLDNFNPPRPQKFQSCSLLPRVETGGQNKSNPTAWHVMHTLFNFDSWGRGCQSNIFLEVWIFCPSTVCVSALAGLSMQLQTSGEQHWVCPSILLNSSISSSGSSPFSQLYSLSLLKSHDLWTLVSYKVPHRVSPPTPNTGLSQRSELCGSFLCQQSWGKLQSGRNLVEMSLHPKKR